MLRLTRRVYAGCLAVAVGIAAGCSDPTPPQPKPVPANEAKDDAAPKGPAKKKDVGDG